MMLFQRLGASLGCALTVAAFFGFQNACCQGEISPKDGANETLVSMRILSELEAGKAVVFYQQSANIKYVVAKIRIEQTPDCVWSTLVNPYEFAGKICPRMSKVQMLVDEKKISFMRCTVKVFFPIPDIVYTVESRYSSGQRVDFQRVEGSFKDFRGSWLLQPLDDGKATEVTYAMYVDTGLPVPEWLVRQAVKNELPATLTGLRRRVLQLKAGKGEKVSRSTRAVEFLEPTVAAQIKLDKAN